MKKLISARIAALVCVPALAIISGCETVAADDYEAMFIGDFKVVKQDEHRPLTSVTIHFDKDRNGYIALQAPGQSGYTSVHLWACKSIDFRRHERDVQAVRCGGDDNQQYEFEIGRTAAIGSEDADTVDMHVGIPNLYGRSYTLAPVKPQA